MCAIFGRILSSSFSVECTQRKKKKKNVTVCLFPRYLRTILGDRSMWKRRRPPKRIICFRIADTASRSSQLRNQKQRHSGISLTHATFATAFVQQPHIVRRKKKCLPFIRNDEAILNAAEEKSYTLGDTNRIRISIIEGSHRFLNESVNSKSKRNKEESYISKSWRV